MRETVAQRSVLALSFALLICVGWQVALLSSAYWESQIRIITGF
jgi:hypothetical protein